MDCGPDDEHQHGHGHGDGGQAVEWKKVAELRAVGEAQDPAAKIHTSVVIGHGHCGDDDAEWKKVAELRAVAEDQDPASKEEDDFVLGRFLRARENTMLLQYLAWKRVAKPHSSTSDDRVRDELVEDRVHMQGFDGLNRPMTYLYGARHFPARRDLYEFNRYVIYVVGKICTRRSIQL